MEAKELRIGNYVTVLGEDKEVKGLGSWNGTNYDQRIYVEFDNLLPIKTIHLKPIPLTEQWLIDFGFELTDNEFHKEIDANWCYLCVDAVDFSISLYDNIENFKKGDYCCLGSDADCKHVHQLQNLYFALTGKELTLQK